MDLHVDDDGFVRAPAAECYRALTDVRAWGTWWPGTRVVDLGQDRAQVSAGRGRRRLRLELQAHGWRHDEGVRLRMTGAVAGEAEFWLEPGWGGTVVHHLATVRVTGRGAAGAYRRWIRTGLWGLKDHVHGRLEQQESA